jgi:RHH-type proline utilization regulon transcriptional repressor/proline dehydrogenase/delta 1-pyrroline-5-carboxylate dehydrogenase
MAARAVALMHEAGIPKGVLTLVTGPGATVGAALVADPRIAGVCFTGSTETAILIDRAMATAGNPRAPLIAETGGLNAMLVDSTALPEHAVRDIVTSAFQSAGQRCSALRVLCLQREVADIILEMLEGALAELEVGDPWQQATDIGPVIDAGARAAIEAHCHSFARRGRLLFSHPFERAGATGHHVAPTVLRIDSLNELEREVFGPVLHVLTFEAEQLDAVVDAINASGYGLTLGVHSRVGDRVDRVCARARVGNIYVNRNQIGAVVGVQPFGGEGLSGTGPKAGGPHYLDRFTTAADQLQLPMVTADPTEGEAVTAVDWQNFLATAGPMQPAWEQDGGRMAALVRASALLPAGLRPLAESQLETARTVLEKDGQLPGPTGESNTLSWHGRGPVLCLGGGVHPPTALLLQALSALAAGNPVALAAGVDDTMAAQFVSILAQSGVPVGLAGVVKVCDTDLATLPGLRVVALEGDDRRVGEVRRSLAARDGIRVPLVALADGVTRFATERVISVDTTASGGNTALLTLEPYP